LDAVRDIERRIQIAEEQSSRELPTMEHPASGYPPLYEDYAKLMIDLQVVALQADMTRVITFMLAHELSNRTYREIGIPDGHHGLSHHRGDPGQIAKIIKLNGFHVKQLAYYMERLRATPDGDGTLLDHSMIVYGSGIADGNLHTNEDIPILLVGGANGKIKSGRHIRYPKGTPVANLYVSMLDMMGVRDDKFGDRTAKLDLLSVASAGHNHNSDNANIFSGLRIVLFQTHQPGQTPRSTTGQSRGRGRMTDQLEDATRTRVRQSMIPLSGELAQMGVERSKLFPLRRRNAFN